MFKGVEQREGQDGVVPLQHHQENTPRSPGVTVPGSEQEIPLFAAGHVTARDEMEW